MVVVTGASSGIGRATSLEIASQGGSLVLVSRQEQALQELASECRKRGGEALAGMADVTDEKAVSDVFEQALERFGRIDALVNNAAVTAFGGIDEVSMDAFRRVIETNLIGYVHCIRSVLPHFRKRGTGTIVNVSSVISKAPQPFTTAYSASKCAINGLSDALRAELADEPGIQLCTVLPPSVDTPIFQHGANYSGHEVKPMQPVYSARKVADVIVASLVHPQREIHIGFPGPMITALKNVAPAISDMLFSKKVRDDHFMSSPAMDSQGNLKIPDTERNEISGGWKDDDPTRTQSHKT